MLSVAVVVTKMLLAAGSAEDRRVLSAVTPDTLAKGETVQIKWNYENGNGGEHLQHYSSISTLQYSTVHKSNERCNFLYTFQSSAQSWGEYVKTFVGVHVPTLRFTGPVPTDSRQ